MRYLFRWEGLPPRPDGFSNGVYWKWSCPRTWRRSSAYPQRRPSWYRFRVGLAESTRPEPLSARKRRPVTQAVRLLPSMKGSPAVGPGMQATARSAASGLPQAATFRGRAGSIAPRRVCRPHRHARRVAGHRRPERHSPRSSATAMRASAKAVAEARSVFPAFASAASRVSSSPPSFRPERNGAEKSRAQEKKISPLRGPCGPAPVDMTDGSSRIGAGRPHGRKTFAL